MNYNSDVFVTRMIVSLFTDTGNYNFFHILQHILKRQTNCIKIPALLGIALISFHEILTFRDGVENIMTDYGMDKTKEKANTAFNETRNETRDSYDKIKSSAESSFKTAGVEGQKVMDEVKKTGSKAVSDLQGDAKKAGEKYDEMGAAFNKNMESVVTMITENPIPAVLVAIGVGFLAGMLIRK